jgi:hypothetical protein
LVVDTPRSLWYSAELDEKEPVRAAIRL